MKPKAMVNWFDPRQLLRTAVRVAISTVFGEFADRREFFASARVIDWADFQDGGAYDYRGGKGDFWFDFVADTGDGWASTFAVASLLALPDLRVGEVETRRGQVLVMGGDQVYPTASREEYEDRLLGPFEIAARRFANLGRGERIGDVYAIPGNHDWYDGLNSFLGIFCRRRSDPTDPLIRREGRLVGQRRTQQVRSYFALRLPGNWWLWGIDAQLAGYVDQPQVDFFNRVARQDMGENANVILCVPEPVWAMLDPKDPGEKFKTFSYMEGLAAQANKSLKVRAVIAGDLHHYARYTEGDTATAGGRHYITAGGGGAFLHPTHVLTDRAFSWAYGPPGAVGTRERSFAIATSANHQKALFPSAAMSRALSLRNLGFALLNRWFTAMLCLFAGLFAWSFDAGLRAHDVNLFSLLRDTASVGDAVTRYLQEATVSPAPALWTMMIVLACFLLSDFKTLWIRWAEAALHTAAQVFLFILVLAYLARALPDATPGYCYLVAAGLAGGIAASTLVGLYLLICIQFGIQSNLAFSSLSIQDFKCFLRLKIDEEGDLHIYPVGIRRVRRDGNFCDQDLSQAHLIEDPIKITK